MTRRIFFGSLLLALCGLHGFGQGPKPDFSGTWKLSGDRSAPKRDSNATLRIEHHDPELTVETSSIRVSGVSRHAVQRYRTDGKVSVTTGADGDEFHTAISWKDRALLFSIEEHEDGRVLASKEEWTLIDNGAVLQRVRDTAHGEKQTLIYLKETR